MDEMYFGTMGWMRDQNNKPSYFYGNVCHVCKQYNKPLFDCRECNMVAYCCDEHEQHHMTDHEQICNIIVQERSRMSNPTVNTIKTEDWKKRKENFMLSVQAKLRRPLHTDEREMFLFPISCMECHDQGDSLKRCKSCPSINFCQTHDTADEQFDHSCEIFRLCFKLDMLTEPPDLGYLRHLPVIIKYYDVDNGCLNFIQYCVEGYLNERGNSVLQAIHSQLITQPLTMLHAAKLINYDFNRHELCIHIIASNFTEENIMDTWEILFHSERMLQCINIIIIGLELQELPTTTICSLCPRCTFYGKKITFSVHACLYSTYVRSSKFVEPDLFIGYNPRISMQKLIYQRGNLPRVGRPLLCNNFPWQWRIIELLKRIECPVILTSYTKEEAIKDAEKINDVIGQQITCHTRAQRNPFASMRPYRDPETEQPVFQNSFLTIYTNIKAQIYEAIRLSQ